MYQSFLQQNGHSPKLIWVELTDILLTDTSKVYVKLPVSQQNMARARKLFESGMGSGLGVKLHAIANLKDSTCCYAWVPKDQVDQEYALMGSGLKMSALSDESRRKGTAIRSRLRWAMLKKRFQKHSAMVADLFG